MAQPLQAVDRDIPTIRAVLREPAFRWLCTANYIDAIGTWLERLAVGWFVLDTTGSVFLTALSFAARSAPNMFLGSLGGVVADRFSRTRVLSTTTAAKALLMCALAACGFLRLHSAWPVLTIVALSSVARASEQPSVQGILGDIGRPSGLARATSLHSTGARTVGLLASLAGGVLLDVVGPGPVFLIAAVTSAIASLVYARMRVARRVTTTPSMARGSFAHDTAEGFRVALASPAVRVLLILAVAVEVFAFSYQSLMPSFADRVLHVGATGLGALTFGTGLGGVLGLLVLTRLIETQHRGRLMCGVTLTFALALLALASTEVFPVAVALLVVVGAMAAMFDALQWALLQSTVPDEIRGRVIGLWMTAIGFGWLGPVILGGIAEIAGTRSAIASGGAIALVAAAAALATPRLRRL